ncbi:MAG: outer membrane usher protein FimD/PapC [Candidatus Marinamargulisbacteria bacterium]|jgi:outer membrane usher protein FimD/PapC
MIRVCFFFLFFSLICPVFSQSVDGSMDAMFEEAFGRKAPQERHTLMVNLRIDGDSYGQIEVSYNPYTEAIWIPGAELWESLSKRVLATGKPSYDSVLLPSRDISGASLIQLGYRVEFDQKYLLLRLRTPAKWRKKTTLSISSHFFEKGDYEATQPSEMSGYMNFSALRSQDFNLGLPSDRRYFFRMDSAHNVNNAFTVESEMDVSRGIENSAEIRRLTVVTEREDESLEVEYGLFDPGSSFFPSRLDRTVGVSILKDYQTFGRAKPRSSFKIPIVLEEAGEVAFYVDGRLYKTMKLDEGHYEFVDPPLTQGETLLQIKFQSKSGKQVLLAEKELYYHSNLLKKGDSEFRGTLGMPAERQTSGQQKVPVSASLSGAFGMSNRESLLGGLEYQDNQFGIGLGGYQVSKLGYMAYLMSAQDQSFSSSFEFQGYSHSFLYDSEMNHNFFVKARKSATLVLNDASLGSATLATLKWDAFCRFESRVGLRCRIALSQVLKTPYNASLFQISVNNKFGDITLDQGIEWEQDLNNEQTWRFFLRGSFSSGDFNNNLNMATKGDDGQGSFSLQYRPKTISDLSYVARMGRNVGRNVLSNQLRYEDYYISHQWEQGIGGESDLQSADVTLAGNRGTLRHSQSFSGSQAANTTTYAETSLAYADGRLGVGRRVHQNFVLFYAPDSLRAKNIRFQTRDHIDFLGPAVVSNLPMYRNNTVAIQDAKFQGDIFLPDRIFKVFSRRRQGIAMSIAPTGIMILQGVLLDVSGDPLVYEFGDLVSEKGRSLPFFTNRKGRFMVSGLSPGSYTLVFQNAALSETAVMIPEIDKSLYNMGEVNIKHARE